MMPGPDLADLIAYAAARGGKVILAGDTSRLQAVENGGGMSLLADTLGYARLAEPVRFRAAWEQEASLRLRDGDTSVLATYDQHARVFGGDPEQMMDAAAATYAALTVSGTDTLLMTADHAPATAAASRAGGPGGPLASGDLLRIDAVTPGGLLVRRALDPDPAAGQRQWTTEPFLYANYRDAELGYAVTGHVAQGRTVHTAMAVFTGNEDRQQAYAALTRGTDANLACVFTLSPKRADPVPGPRPAPELTRYDRLHPERAGNPGLATPPEPPATTATATCSPKFCHPCRRRSRRRPPARRPRDGRQPARARGQLPGPARRLPPARDRLRRDHGRPRRLGRRHPRRAPPRCRRRRRAAPPPPRSAVASAALRRTRTRTRTRTSHRTPAGEPVVIPDEQRGEIGQLVTDLAAHRTFAGRLADRQGLTVPSPDPGFGDLGQAFPPWPRRSRDAILQPPKPEIRPSPKVLERAADRDADWEAAD
jgi:hypothetical protein